MSLPKGAAIQRVVGMYSVRYCAIIGPIDRSTEAYVRSTPLEMDVQRDEEA
jgi:hypothetical protein